MEKIFMRPGIKSKSQSANLIESSIRLKNSIQENSQIQKIMTEESRECLKERELDRLTTSHISLEVLLKKNKCIETTIKLILKKIQKMTSLMKKWMKLKLQHQVNSSTKFTISLKHLS